MYFNALLVINIFRHFYDVIHLFRNIGKHLYVSQGVEGNLDVRNSVFPV